MDAKSQSPLNRFIREPCLSQQAPDSEQSCLITQVQNAFVEKLLADLALFRILCLRHFSWLWFVIDDLRGYSSRKQRYRIEPPVPAALDDRVDLLKPRQYREDPFL